MNGVNLNDAVMSEVQMSNAELERAQLNGVILNDAVMNEVRMSNAELEGAQLNRSYFG